MRWTWHPLLWLGLLGLVLLGAVWQDIRQLRADRAVLAETLPPGQFLPKFPLPEQRTVDYRLSRDNGTVCVRVLQLGQTRIVVEDAINDLRIARIQNLDTQTWWSLRRAARYHPTCRNLTIRLYARWVPASLGLAVSLQTGDIQAVRPLDAALPRGYGASPPPSRSTP